MEEHVALGAAIHRMRGGRMSLQDLADKSNVSVGSLSQIENGRGNPSFAMLERIASAMNVDATQLLSAPPTSATAIVRAGERSKHRRVQDVDVEMLTPDIWHDVTVTHHVLAAGQHSTDVSYSGDVCILLQRGRMRVESEGETVDLVPGDSINYSIPRRGMVRRNIGKSPVVFIAAFRPRETE